MSSSARISASRAPYHHGDLRRALIDAARDLVRTSGADDVSLREVARHAGVSHAAAYHHFVDKNDLLRAMAILAFEDLGAEIARASEDTSGPSHPLERIGVAYLRFALGRPSEFRFMFRRDLCMPPGVPDPLEVVSRQAQAVVSEAVLRCQAAGSLRSGDVDVTTLTLWSVIHGLTSIVLETPAFKSIEPADAEALAVHAVRQLIDGIG